MLVQLVLRKFLLLENVGKHPFCQLPWCMDYNHGGLTTHSLKKSVLASEHSQAASEASEFSWSSVTGHDVGAPVGTWVLSCHQKFTQWSCKKNQFSRLRFLANVYSSCWRLRDTTFLRTGFEWKIAHIMLKNCCHWEFRAVPARTRSSCPVEFLKSWPQKLWMKSQKKPPLHEWLMRARCEDYKHRMNAHWQYRRAKHGVLCYAQNPIDVGLNSYQNWKFIIYFGFMVNFAITLLPSSERCAEAALDKISDSDQGVFENACFGSVSMYSVLW